MKRNLTDMADETQEGFTEQKNFDYGISIKRSKNKKTSVLSAEALNLFGAKLEEYLTEILKEELKKNFKLSKFKRILVVGLGNKDIFNDSLGPQTIEKLLVSRGLDLKPEVCAIAPNVFSNTGIETFDIISSIVKVVEPDLVILIDSLATLSVERLCTCIQVSKGGLVAGSGANLKNKKISKTSLNVKNLISIGVPMLIYAENLLKETKGSASTNLILSPVNIRKSLTLLSNIISSAINGAIFKGMSKEEIDALTK